jgi:hypothetical protein
MKIKEIWKDTEVEGYQISNLGNIQGPKGNSVTTNNRGYFCKHMYSNGNRVVRYIHRLVAISFIDNPQNYKEVNHIDGDKTNNRVDNLEWVSRSMNMKHAYDNGLVKVPVMFGKDNPAYKHGNTTPNYRGARKSRVI